MTAKLIFDIGANNGDDTAFYLAKGFRVVAVEADPALCTRLRARFAAEIASGALIVENIGVAGSEGTLEFYVNSYSEWSSFLKEGKATSENTHERITIATIPMARLLERHGTPYYLKIDIEGFEKTAIATLMPGMAMPDYLSFEVNDDWPAISQRLMGLGYKGFAIVRQGRGILPDPPQPAREGRYVAQTFEMSMSGCFGQEVAAPWIPGNALADAMEKELAAARTREMRGFSYGWYDIHCRLTPI